MALGRAVVGGSPAAFSLHEAVTRQISEVLFRITLAYSIELLLGNLYIAFHLL